MTKVLFIQPGYAHYRKDLFDIFHANYDVLFVFLKEISTYPANQGPNGLWNIKYLGREKSKAWGLSLIAAIYNFKPDVIVTSNNGSYQSIISGIAGRLLSIPVVLWSESWEYPALEYKRAWHSKLLKNVSAKLTSSLAKSIVICGTKSRAYNNKLLYKPKPMFFAPQSTIDMHMYSQDKHKCITNEADTNTINILYFSKIIILKGLDYLIKAFSEIESKHTNVTLTVVGDGPFRTNCENLAKELQIQHIEFVGPVPNENAWVYYQTADIFVLPNSGIGGKDGWGLVINEAASMSLPIITTDAVGAAGDLVINGLNGYVVKAGDVYALKNAIEDLVQDEYKRIEMGRQSRKLFLEFNDYNKMYRGFNDAIKAVTKKA